MQVKPWMSSEIGGTIINPTIKKYLNRQPCYQEHTFEHFNGNGHNGFLENVSIPFIDKTDPSNYEKRENYWMQTLKTMVPWCLNVLGNSG